MTNKYEKIQFRLGSTIDDAVNKLLSYKEKRILVYGEFNGVTLYSDKVTLESAYQEIIGKSKEQFTLEKKKRIKMYESKKKEHEKKIPELTIFWKDKGRKVLSEDRWELWDKVIPIRLNDLYQGMELGCCLDIISVLNNNGTLDEAKNEIASQDHSGMSFRLVCSLVEQFSERGREFVEHVL